MPNARNKRSRNAARNGMPPVLPPQPGPPAQPGPFEGLDEEMVRMLTEGIDPYAIIGQQQAELAKLRIALDLALRKLKQFAAQFKEMQAEDEEDGEEDEGDPQPPGAPVMTVESLPGETD